MKSVASNQTPFQTVRRAARCRWSFFAVSAFWLFVLAVNWFGLFPQVGFRGIRYGGFDFGQYYAAGVAAATGLWSECYPDPSRYEQGKRPATAPYRPGMASELARRGADIRTKNIYPPPTAVLFAPLARWNYADSERRFIGFLVVCGAVFLFLLFKECLDVGLSVRTANWLVFLAGTGFPFAESVMFGNVTVLLGLSGLLALRGIRHAKTVPTVAGFAVAGLTKGFSAAWVPALFLWRRWKILAVGAVVGALLFCAPLLMGSGTDVYGEYVQCVLPASRGNLYRIGDSNLGFPSFFAWLFGWSRIPGSVARLFTVLQAVVCASAYWFAFRASRRLADATVRSQGLALLAVTIAFQVFSTVCWPHYAVNILPFVPVAVAAASRDKRPLAVFLVGVALVWFPVGNALKHLSGVYVFGFGRFFGYVILLAWALRELSRLANVPSGRPMKREEP